MDYNVANSPLIKRPGPPVSKHHTGNRIWTTLRKAEEVHSEQLSIIFICAIYFLITAHYKISISTCKSC